MMTAMQKRSGIPRVRLLTTSVALALLMATSVATLSAQAQTFTVLYSGDALDQQRQTSRASPIAADITAIQHIVFIIKENRSFDTYFGTFPGADGATTGTISTGEVIQLSHAPDVAPRSPGYHFADGGLAMNYGKMDK